MDTVLLLGATQGLLLAVLLAATIKHSIAALESATRNLVLNFDAPVRYYFNPTEATKLGETKVLPHVVVQNLWLFVGVRF